MEDLRRSLFLEPVPLVLGVSELEESAEEIEVEPASGFRVLLLLSLAGFSSVEAFFSRLFLELKNRIFMQYQQACF